MLAAERDIAIIAADLGLRPGLYRRTTGIDPQVHRRLAPALAHRFDLDQRIGKREQLGRSGEQPRLEIGAWHFALPSYDFS